MGANVEIKAKATDPDGLLARVEPLADGPPEILDQRDTFFAAPSGRLKLRDFGDGRGELIQYHRDDREGPKTSQYTIARTHDPEALRAILSDVAGVIGVVSKRRRVYRVGQTRVHLDRVAELGDFLELEVVLKPGQSEAEGTAVAEGLMEALGIARRDLVRGAYLDLILAGAA